MEAFFRRLMGLRLLPAILLCLPGIALCAWYTSSAVLAFKRYEFAQKDKVSLNTEFFHIYLHDQFERDIRWLATPRYSSRIKLSVIEMNVSRSEMMHFLAGAGKETARPWGKAKFAVDGRTYDSEIRIRGTRHWHYVTKKKSIKVKMEEGTLFRGNESFNLINQSEPLIAGQKVIVDIAKDNDVIVPDYDFVRLILNGEDLGVYHLQAQPDQSLFRRQHMMPGALFSGNPSDDADALSLWKSPDAWKSVTTYREGGVLGQAQLKIFLDQLCKSSFAEFNTFAHQYLDLPAFAAFEALDVVFGIEQHGFSENQKLIYDPFRGRWLPVAWDLRGFKHDGVFNRAENPITLRLKMMPEYRLLRDQAVYALLSDDCSVAEVKGALRGHLRSLARELESDRLFSAYKLLPKTSDFAFRMLRPMDLRTAALVTEAEVLSFRKRHSFLMNRLRKNPLFIDVLPTREAASATPSATAETAVVEADSDTIDVPVVVADPEADAPAFITPLVLLVDGAAAAAVQRFDVQWPPDCAEPRWRVEDANGRTVTSGRESGRLAHESILYAGASIEAGQGGSDGLNTLQMVFVPTAWPHVLRSSCAPAKVRVFGRNPVSGAAIIAHRADPMQLAAAEQKQPAPDEVPAFAPGQRTPRPGAIQPPTVTPVVLGPGIVDLPRTRRFAAHQHVTVQPGTTFLMGKMASLIFEGPVHMAGTRNAPVLLKPAGSDPWGGIAITGPGASGSNMSHVTAEGGDMPQDSAVLYPGMINVHDASDVTISNCVFRANRGKGDMFHGAYARNLVVDQMTVENTSLDALDLEFCDARITGLRLQHIGDDGIDLMDTRLSLRESVIRNVTHNGISAGQETRLTTDAVVVALAQTGILAKDASRIALLSTLLYRNRIGLDIEDESDHYDGSVTATADLLYIVGSKTPQKRKAQKGKKPPALDDGYIRYGFSDYRTLRGLFSDVLRIGGPEDLSALFPGEVTP